MSIIKKVIGVLLSVTVILSSVSVLASAIDMSEDDPIIVQVLTDRDSYGITQTVNVTVQVTNRSRKTVENIIVVPYAEKHVMVGKASTKYEIAQLSAGETQEVSFRAVLSRKASGLSFITRLILFFNQLFKRFTDFEKKEYNMDCVSNLKTIEQGGVSDSISVNVWHNGNTSNSFNVVKDSDGDIIALEGAYTYERINSFDDAIDSLYEIKNTIEIDDPQKECKPFIQNSSDASETFVLQQMYNNVPVYARTLSVSVNKQGEPYLLNSSYNSDINVSTNPRKTESQIVEILNANYNSDYAYTVDGLTIFSLYDYEDSPVLTYAVNAEQNDICVEKIFVDAQNGSVVYVDSHLISLTAEAKDELGKTRAVPVYLSGGKYYLYDSDRMVQPYNTSSLDETPYSSSTDMLPL